MVDFNPPSSPPLSCRWLSRVLPDGGWEQSVSICTYILRGRESWFCWYGVVFAVFSLGSAHPFQGRSLHIADQDLNFTGVVIDDPMPTGRQIIEAVGNRKAEEHLVFQVLRKGELEELNLEETTDLLRAAMVERFLIFNSAASYRFDIDGERLEWGHSSLSAW